jgi:hypothetical protein
LTVLISNLAIQNVTDRPATEKYARFLIDGLISEDRRQKRAADR